MTKLLLPALLLTLSGFVETGTVQPPDGERGKQVRERSRKACQGKSDGATCSFETPRGKMEGHCRSRGGGEGEGALMCVPKQREERRKRAAQACKGKKAGDACQVQTPRGARGGKCQEAPDGLMCRPERRPPPPSR